MNTDYRISERHANEGIRRELDAVVHTLQQVMTSHKAARSAFLTGSAVTGEWAAVELSDGWYIFSDLDIGVIADPRDPALEKAIRADMRGAIDRLATERHWLRAPGANVGFFTFRELAYQAAKPGTLEMINQATVLWGDRSIRDHFPPLGVEDLTWEEAIRILGNRVLELLERPGSDEIRPLDYYRLAKLYCDFATAMLIPEGGYVTGSRQRAQRLPAMLSDRPLPPKLERSRDRLIESVEFWTAFRSSPRMELLRERYGMEPVGEEGRALYGGIWCEARRLLEACLEALLPHRLLDTNGRPDPAAIARSSGWGSWRHRVREWRWLSQYDGVPTARTLARGARLAFRLSPVEITYLMAFILFGRSVDGPPPLYLDDELIAALSRWYPLPHRRWTTGEETRVGVVELWRYWLPRI